LGDLFIEKILIELVFDNCQVDKRPVKSKMRGQFKQEIK